MNNNAFKELVLKHASVTTKQIARKAVEEEFQRKRKRRKGGDSSDEEDGEDTKSNKRGGKRGTPKKEEEDEEAKQEAERLAGKYRDRAKDRREGKITGDDQQPSQFLMPRKFASQAKRLVPIMSVTSVKRETVRANIKETPEARIKRLDRILGQTVRDQIARRQPNREVEDKSSYYGPQSMGDEDNIITSDEALTYLQNLLNEEKEESSTDKTEQTAYVEQLVLQTIGRLNEAPSDDDIHAPPEEQSLSVAAMNIQKSVLRFSLHANLHDRKRAWETPSQINVASFEVPSPPIPATSLSMAIIDRVNATLSARKNISAVKSKELQASKDKKRENEGGVSLKAGEVYSDDDDDIFGDVDSDYVPPEEEKSKTSKADPADEDDQKDKPASKKSIFDGLGGAAKDSVETDKKDSIQTFVETLMRRKGKPQPNNASGPSNDYGEMDAEESSDDDDDSKSKKQKKKKGKDSSGDGEDES